MSDRPRWEVEGRDWPLRAHSRFIAAAGLRWHVQLMGAGPVLLLLHGTGAATHSWRGVAPLLAKRFTVVAPDLPGHGFTTGRPVGGMRLPAVAGAVTELLAALDLAPRMIVGHSAGAAVGIRMALDGMASCGGIVGIGAALLPFPGVAGRLFPSLAKLLFVNPFAPHLFATIARAPGEPERFLQRSTGSTIDAAGVDCYRRLFGTASHCAGAIAMMADWDLEALKRDLPTLRAPLLLVHGARDAAVPPSAARETAALVPGTRLVALPGLGHLAHEEQPGRIAEIVEGFACDHAILAAAEGLP